MKKGRSFSFSLVLDSSVSNGTSNHKFVACLLLLLFLCVLSLMYNLTMYLNVHFSLEFVYGPVPLSLSHSF